MSNLVLYQNGSKSLDPKKKAYYDPWANHIWLCIEQVRRWNPDLPIYMITDTDDVSGKENFSKYGVVVERISELPYKHDLSGSDYFKGDINPIAREGCIRTFYIESVMRKHGLRDTITFDNDILVFCDLSKVARVASQFYQNVAVTPLSDMEKVLGMVYVKDADAMERVNDRVWNLMNNDVGRYLLEMRLWGVIGDQPNSPIENLPIWPDGKFSDHHKEFGGIFDPASIGQHLGGCDNGNPKGVIFRNHYIHNRLMERRWGFVHSVDGGRKYISVYDTSIGEITKVMSLHIHNKRLGEFM
jgi:hypothetical protein